MVNATAPIGILRTLAGEEFEVFVGLRPIRKAMPSQPPPTTITTTGTAVESPPAALARPSLRLVTGRAA